jgi:uncharacterized membrane protein YbaN (DUF454 family)
MQQYEGYSQSILKDIGRSYVVSSLLPATVFVILAVLVFKDLLFSDLIDTIFIGQSGQAEQINQVEQTETVLLATALFVLIVLTTWFGFFLYSTQNVIIPIFEGYLIPKRLRWFLKTRKIEKTKEKHKGDFEKLRQLAQQYRDKLQEKHPKDSEEAKRLEKGKKAIRDNALDILNLLREDHIPVNYNHFQQVGGEDFSPIVEDWMLPTKLGDILRFGETYPSMRYGFDGTAMWLRLWPMLSEEYSTSIEENNNRLMFLLNTCFCLAIITLGSLLVTAWFTIETGIRLISPVFQLLLEVGKLAHTATVTGVPLKYTITPLNFDISLQWGWLWQFSLLSLSGIALISAIYFFSTRAAEDLTDMVIAAFDLFRLKLLKQLKQNPPDNLKTEKEIWKSLDLFFGVGEFFEELEIDYKSKEDKPISSKKKSLKKNKKKKAN